jgi:translation elongation factor EF-G
VWPDGQYFWSAASSSARAARIAINEAMLKCCPVLMVSILVVKISMASEFTSKVNFWRGQLLVLDARPG